MWNLVQRKTSSAIVWTKLCLVALLGLPQLQGPALGHPRACDVSSRPWTLEPLGFRAWPPSGKISQGTWSLASPSSFSCHRSAWGLPAPSSGTNRLPPVPLSWSPLQELPPGKPWKRVSFSCHCLWIWLLSPDSALGGREGRWMGWCMLLGWGIFILRKSQNRLPYATHSVWGEVQSEA